MTRASKFWLVAAAVASFGMIGCGGSSNNDTARSPWAGVYQATYTRGPGSVMFHVENNGDLHIVVHDEDLQETYTGETTINAQGEFSGEATHVGGTHQIQFTGEISGTGVSGLVTGSITGQFDATFSGSYQSSGDENMFADEYFGSFIGDASGSVNLTVAANGTVTVTATDDNGSFSGTGTVSTLGLVTVNANGDGPTAGTTYSFSGFLKPSGSGGGAWEFTDGGGTGNTVGTWTVSNQVD